MRRFTQDSCFEFKVDQCSPEERKARILAANTEFSNYLLTAVIPKIDKYRTSRWRRLVCAIKNFPRTLADALHTPNIYTEEDDDD